MYVIKGFWGEDPAYYVGISPSKLGDLTCVNLSTALDKATKFDSVEKAEECFKFISPELFKIYPICPRCHKEYDGKPAISRDDNKTEICPDCGTQEALIIFMKNTKKRRE